MVPDDEEEEDEEYDEEEDEDEDVIQKVSIVKLNIKSTFSIMSVKQKLEVYAILTEYIESFHSQVKGVKVLDKVRSSAADESAKVKVLQQYNLQLDKFAT